MVTTIAVPPVADPSPLTEQPARTLLPSWLAAAGGWLRLALVTACRVYRAGLLTLALAALVPALWGWSSYEVRSGSMEPDISVGDVVVAQPFATQDRVDVGRVMLFDAPRLAGREVVVHRVVAERDDGRYITAGDANPQLDSTPVSTRQFLGRAVILVPWVGLPFQWLVSGNLESLVGWLVLTAAAFVLPMARPGVGKGAGRRRRSAKAGAAAVLATALVGGTLAAVGATAGSEGAASALTTASAGFSARTSTRPNTWKVGTKTLQRYSAAVLQDDPQVYYRMDEANGTVAVDESGNGLPGTYASVGSYRQPGALPNNFGYSVGFNANGGRLFVGGPAASSPTAFTAELWFRTSSSAGGKIFGFESTRNATSPTYDRHLFMRPDGRLVYGGWGSKPSLLVSPAAYNNGGWHHLVLTSAQRQGRQNTVMYVDGQQVAAGVTSATGNYSGWWRVGYGSLPTGSGYPATASFVGNVDAFSGYSTELGMDRVAAHYSAR